MLIPAADPSALLVEPPTITVEQQHLVTGVRSVAIDDNVVVVREAYVDFNGEKTTKEIEMRVRQSQGG